MALGNLFGRRKGKKATDSGEPHSTPAAAQVGTISPETTELGLTLLLGDSQSGRRCSPEYVTDLRRRVAGPAMSELDQLLDPAWFRELVRLSPEEQEGQIRDPAWRLGFPKITLSLEGPTMSVQLVVVKLPGWELQAIATQVYNVFHKHWNLQIDRDQPA
ncbi:hypothetical protein [Virgisporangium aurantiacum]|uniref:Uncharacterized protein n=1 Tax=Virgisporangium aurantiacum TaxID=175570 RepID=A0A8J3ZED2_9ACTN|nr:hypothetical protein [Virgisporangium aurantiacum]GIJ62492.1 hypothetical protein Vau01_100080 [Virgisporangium aurantiacum]